MFWIKAEHRISSSRGDKRNYEKKKDEAGAICSDIVTFSVMVQGLPPCNPLSGKLSAGRIKFLNYDKWEIKFFLNIRK